MVTRASGDDFPFEDTPFDRSPPAGEESEPVREARAGRKQRVLHTRISEQLSEDIRQAAEDLRVPVSNLVRNVLEEAFGAIERVSDEVGGFLEEAFGDAAGAREDLRRLGRRMQDLARRQRHRFAQRGPLGDAGGANDADRAEQEQRKSESAPAREAAPPAQRASPPARPAPSFDLVIGWQPLLANAAAACAGCERPLAAGEHVFAGATEHGLSRTFLCGACLRARSGA